ncbi:MAG TPA: GNAT family N-acetyltransferase [Aquabacterium sp.]|uniref:GNAT family N-acetyltransferase n=1 Tax=Aquabacterium sp. TaxID=1872578 RepID=UPI002E379F2A|nr:GNAT family N-acetyltransferase [Aquabacterium sp.]HEX5372229.1 GNAT family N-acetyltransferase [Aquabacterium sp.]
MVTHDLTGLRIARVTPAELSSFKSLRDEGLRLHPEAFDADLDIEQSRPPESYIGRLGLYEPLGGTFLIGAWVRDEMVGMVGLERHSLPKLRHSAELNSMMVKPTHSGCGIGFKLIDECLRQARAASGLELITLKVSTANQQAVQLYERAGFKPCGIVPRAVRLVGPGGSAVYVDRLTMALLLKP